MTARLPLANTSKGACRVCRATVSYGETLCYTHSLERNERARQAKARKAKWMDDILEDEAASDEKFAQVWGAGQ